MFDDYENFLPPAGCRQSIVIIMAKMCQVLTICQIPCILSSELAYLNLRMFPWSRFCACSGNPCVRTQGLNKFTRPYIQSVFELECESRKYEDRSMLNSKLSLPFSPCETHESDNFTQGRNKLGKIKKMEAEP